MCALPAVLAPQDSQRRIGCSLSRPRSSRSDLSMARRRPATRPENPAFPDNCLVIRLPRHYKLPGTHWSRYEYVVLHKVRLSQRNGQA